MAETITIPSPSVFLRSPVQQTPAEPPTKNTPKRPSTSAAKSSASEQAQASGVTKRKQSKSRNGCITCKAKRLKCDETKPSCQQCARRSVTCGGYKKDFKWRPFEETNFAAKPPGKPKKPQSPPIPHAGPVHEQSSPRLSESQHELSTECGPYPEPAFYHRPAMHGVQMPQPDFLDPSAPDAQHFRFPPSTPFVVPPERMPHNHDAGLDLRTRSATTGFTEMDTLNSATTAPSSLSSGQSPKLADLLAPATDMHTPSPEYISFGSKYPDSIYQPIQGLISQEDGDVGDADVEDIVRQPEMNADPDAWLMSMPSPTSSHSSGSSSDTAVKIANEPQFHMGSPEMLMLRFDRQTCGILSVKDGPTENPWRTLVWPLARDNAALYHAIASMTSFHASKLAPDLRVQGITHMHNCFRALRTMGMENMPIDTAIATALVLGFAESWDVHTSTGINHIKGAKILVDQALIQHRASPLQGERLRRLRFLINTWVYMDVIARLTSVDDDESTDFDHVFSFSSGSSPTSPTFSPTMYLPLMEADAVDVQLDPLMGVASTLFPIIGRVANLVRRVRRTSSNSPAIVSTAMSLKTALEDWSPPPISVIEDPEDPSSNVQHNLQTAEAYRWATLLYLHQAVPEIPSLSSAELAKKVLLFLATVPLSSRAVIVQIFPLTAGGCEANSEEDRAWVRDRWESMAQRMRIGVIDRCADVCGEVWKRRDEYEAKTMARSMRASGNAFDSLKRDYPNEDELMGRLKREFHNEDELIGDPFEWNEGFDSLSFGLSTGGPSSGMMKRRAATGGLDQSLMRPLSEWRRKKSKDAVTREIDPEYTVRGSLHWLGVMKEWDWEVLLG